MAARVGSADFGDQFGRTPITRIPINRNRSKAATGCACRGRRRVSANQHTVHVNAIKAWGECVVVQRAAQAEPAEMFAFCWSLGAPDGELPETLKPSDNAVEAAVIDLSEILGNSSASEPMGSPEIVSEIAGMEDSEPSSRRKVSGGALLSWDSGVLGSPAIRDAVEAACGPLQDLAFSVVFDGDAVRIDPTETQAKSCLYSAVSASTVASEFVDRDLKPGTYRVELLADEWIDDP